MHGSPRALADSKLLRERLDEVHRIDHARPLNAWVVDERRKRELDIPWFDPADGGTSARVLFLLESPGPRSVAASGSGIISVDNDDPTAQNLWSFRHNAGLTGDVAVHWNLVPWYVPGGSLTEQDRKRGRNMLRGLLQLLPGLQVVVLMGRVAQRGWYEYSVGAPTNLVAVPTWHPGQKSLATTGRRDEVAAAMQTVARVIANEASRPETQPSTVGERSAQRSGRLARVIRKGWRR